jgi:hypothetical protein
LHHILVNRPQSVYFQTPHRLPWVDPSF